MSGKRRIFVSTSCLRGVQALEERLALFRRHGIQAVELGGGIVTDRDWQEILRRSGMDFLIHNFFPPQPAELIMNLASPSGRVRKATLDIVRRGLRTAKDFGMPFYSMHAGFVKDPAGFDGQGFVFSDGVTAETMASAKRIFRLGLLEALEYANEFGVGVAVENNVCTSQLRGHLLLQTADEFLEMYDGIERGWLGILLDVGHLNVTARTYGFDPLAFVQALGTRIWGIHLHGNDGLTDSHEPYVGQGWVREVLSTRELGGVPLVVEARFDSVEELASYYEALREAHA